MKFLRFTLFLALCLLLVPMVGCGGTPSSTTRSTVTPPSPPPAPAPPIGISGNWNIKLSIHQAYLMDPFHEEPDQPTQININFKQLKESPSMLAVNDIVYQASPGCMNNGTQWYGDPQFQQGIFKFIQGTVVDDQIAFQLSESAAASGAPSTYAFGTVSFTGTINNDGTMSGDVNDGCTQQMGTWSASKIDKLN